LLSQQQAQLVTGKLRLLRLSVAILEGKSQSTYWV